MAPLQLDLGIFDHSERMPKLSTVNCQLSIRRSRQTTIFGTNLPAKQIPRLVGPGDVCLPDKIGEGDGLPLGNSVGLLAQLDALDQKAHVPCQGAHLLPSLGVLLRLAGSRAVDAVPILA